MDEVGELPPSIQAKLLRVIEAKEVTRVGGLKMRSLDVRFVSATNRDLEESIRKKQFREDLYFRLNGIALNVPPLRDRPSEIEALAEMMIGEAAQQLGLANQPELLPDTVAILQAYRWPGNVRELRNVMQRAVLLCGGKHIAPDDLPLERVTGSQMATSAAVLANEDIDRAHGGPVHPGSSRASSAPSLRDQRAQAERDKILHALELFVGNQTRAAAYLGIPRRTFVAKLAAYGIPRPRKHTPWPGSEVAGGEPQK